MKMPDDFNYVPINFENMVTDKLQQNISILSKYLQYRDTPFASVLKEPYHKDSFYPPELTQQYESTFLTGNLQYTANKELVKQFKHYDLDFETKLNNYCAKYDLEKEYVLYKVQTDYTFAVRFAVDPGRQSSHQSYAAQQIKNTLFFIDDFHILPSGGQNAKYVIDGRVQCGLNSADGAKGTKSIDFEQCYHFKNHCLKFYASHKHTDAEGGSQDNQFNDANKFLEEGKKNRKSYEQIFVVIVDGEYYLRKSIAHPYGRLKELKSLCTDGTMATNCNLIFRDILNKIIQQLSECFCDDLDARQEIDDIKKILCTFE